MVICHSSRLILEWLQNNELADMQAKSRLSPAGDEPSSIPCTLEIGQICLHRYSYFPGFPLLLKQR